MKIITTIFLTFLFLMPCLLIGKAQKTENNNTTNKIAADIKNFKYLEMNSTNGLTLMVLGLQGYYFENKDVEISPFTLYRLESNETGKLTSKLATKKSSIIEFNGDVTYERSNVGMVKTQYAKYSEQNKTLFASPVYVKIKVND